MLASAGATGDVAGKVKGEEMRINLKGEPKPSAPRLQPKISMYSICLRTWIIHTQHGSQAEIRRLYSMIIIKKKSGQVIFFPFTVFYHIWLVGTTVMSSDPPLGISGVGLEPGYLSSTAQSGMMWWRQTCAEIETGQPVAFHCSAGTISNSSSCQEQT